MTFLQPIVLWGLPLILLPVIIHLLNRLRHRPQAWAAMRFLLAATRSSTGHARLRQFLILLFRTLAVLMLVVFLARPLAGGWLGWALAPAPDAILILLDRSASMEAKAPGTSQTKRELALDLLAQAAHPYQEKSHLILIENVFRAPQEVPQASSLPQMSWTAATETAADIPALLSSALRWIAENRAGNSEIWITSDLQRSNWLPDDSRWKNLAAQLSHLPQKIRIRLLALDRDTAPNRSIALREITRRSGPKTRGLEALLEIEGRSPSDETIPLTQVLNGNRSQAEIQLEGQSMRWRHLLALKDQKESGWGSFELPADGNRHDNTAYFVYGADSTLHSAMVRSDRAAGLFFRLAATASARNPEAAAQLSEAGQFPGLSDESLLIWQAPLPLGAEADKVKKFVEEGGVAMFFPPGEGSTNQFLGFGWGAVQTAEKDKPYKIGHWEREHGPLANTEEGWPLPLQELEFQKRQLIQGDKSALADFGDSVPFLIEWKAGRGEVYFCGSLPGKSWSTLADGQVLVPLVQRCLQAGSRRLQLASEIACGELSVADQNRRWETVDAPQPKDIRTQAGVYRSGDRLLAVNRPKAEDDLERLAPEAGRRLFGAVPVRLFLEEQNRRDTLQGEVWRAFLTLMLLFLVGEAILILPPKRAGAAAAKAHPPQPAPRGEEAPV